MTFKLRDYQREAIDSTWNYLTYRKGNPLIVLPTGSGKTPVMSEMIRSTLVDYPGMRIGVLAHVKELIDQGAKKLAQHWPTAPAGIYSAGLRRRDRFTPIVFAGIQSVAKRARTLGRFDLLLIDEAHRIPLRSEGMYRQFIDDASIDNPNLRVVGLTATEYRFGGGPIVGPDYILNGISYEVKVGDLIRQGYLCRAVGKAGIARADMSEVRIRSGEYVAADLERASNIPEVVSEACDEIVALCANRKKWVIFAAGADHARAVAAALSLRGIPTGMVTQDTPAVEREHIVAAFKARKLRALVNVRIFTEGFDDPEVDAVIMMCATKSPGLYYQEVGRGFRPLFAPGYDLETQEGRLAAQAAGPKPDFLVLDFAGNIDEHGPVDAIRPPKRPGDKATSDAPVKSCPMCQAYMPIQSTVCECGHIFPIADAERGFKHDATASESAILTDELPPAPVANSHAVNSVFYSLHSKPGKPDSMKVSYVCGLRTFNEWVCLNHGGIPRAKAMSWWMARDRTGLTPRNVESALQVAKERLREPSAIAIVQNGKFSEIVGYEFNGSDDAAEENGSASLAVERAAIPGGDAGRDAVRSVHFV